MEPLLAGDDDPVAGAGQPQAARKPVVAQAENFAAVAIFQDQGRGVEDAAAAILEKSGGENGLGQQGGAALVAGPFAEDAAAVGGAEAIAGPAGPDRFPFPVADPQKPGPAVRRAFQNGHEQDSVDFPQPIDGAGHGLRQLGTPLRSVLPVEVLLAADPKRAGRLGQARRVVGVEGKRGSAAPVVVAGGNRPASLAALGDPCAAGGRTERQDLSAVPPIGQEVGPFGADAVEALARARPKPPAVLQEGFDVRPVRPRQIGKLPERKDRGHDGYAPCSILALAMASGWPARSAIAF